MLWSAISGPPASRVSALVTIFARISIQNSSTPSPPASVRMGPGLPAPGNNWCAFFEAVGHPECIEEFSVRDPVARARNIDKIYDRMRDIAPTRTTAEWEELLLRIDVPHTAFAKLTEIAEQPHLKA